MDNPKGRVVSLVDRADGMRALVSVDVVAACPRCAAGKGCGAGLFADGARERRVEAIIPAGLDVAADDDVEITLAPDNLLQAAFIVYGLPMLGAIVAAAIAYALSLSDAAAAAAALLGLATGLVLGRWRLRQTECLRRFVPAIARRLN
jgi:sigma-E factor negative regulatory protein RseC